MTKYCPRWHIFHAHKSKPRYTIRLCAKLKSTGTVNFTVLQPGNKPFVLGIKLKWKITIQKLMVYMSKCYKNLAIQIDKCQYTFNFSRFILIQYYNTEIYSYFRVFCGIGKAYITVQVYDVNFKLTPKTFILLIYGLSNF